MDMPAVVVRLSQAKLRVSGPKGGNYLDQNGLWLISQLVPALAGQLGADRLNSLRRFFTLLIHQRGGKR